MRNRKRSMKNRREIVTSPIVEALYMSCHRANVYAEHLLANADEVATAAWREKSGVTFGDRVIGDDGRIHRVDAIQAFDDQHVILREHHDQTAHVIGIYRHSQAPKKPPSTTKARRRA